MKWTWNSTSCTWLMYSLNIKQNVGFCKSSQCFDSWLDALLRTAVFPFSPNTWLCFCFTSTQHQSWRYILAKAFELMALRNCAHIPWHRSYVIKLWVITFPFGWFRQQYNPWTYYDTASPAASFSLRFSLFGKDDFVALIVSVKQMTNKYFFVFKSNP